MGTADLLCLVQMQVMLGSLCSLSFILISTVILMLEDVPNMCLLQNTGEDTEKGHHIKQETHRI